MSCEKLNQAFSEKNTVAVVCILLNRSLENCFQTKFLKSFNAFVSNANNNQIKSRIKGSKSYWTEILIPVVPIIERKKINQKDLILQPKRCFPTTGSWKLWENKVSSHDTLGYPLLLSSPSCPTPEVILVSSGSGENSNFCISPSLD